MESKTTFGYVLMALGIAGILVGLASVSRDVHLGWGGVAVGAVFNALAFRALKGPPTPASKEPARPVVARSEGTAE